MKDSSVSQTITRVLVGVGLLVVAATITAFTLAPAPRQTQAPTSQRTQEVDRETILRGRQMVIEHGCGGCHGGFDDPSADGWLAGLMSPAQEFVIGPCLWEPGAEPCWKTRPRNLTPDNTTGMGRFSERQIYNALRFGLRPGETADVEITSTTPGEGNFPLVPKYLAPPMPWTAWRHIADEDLWAIAAYLKHGVKPISNRVEDSEGPPDFWASFFTDDVIGTLPSPAFPTAAEVMPAEGAADLDQVLRGRQLVVQHGCGDCHGGFSNPASEAWLAGVTAPFQVFPVGPCLLDPADPCYMMRPRNLTPDEATGTGRYTERQIFNALRHGLRPSSTPDMEITEGDFPDDPDYLAIGMPWAELRHMADEDLWAIAAYLKHGVKPVDNTVEDTDRPAAGWANDWGAIKGTYPPPPFPTKNEVGG